VITPEQAQTNMQAILDRSGARFRLYEHRPVLSYTDAELARQEAGFTGTEGKALVVAADERFAVFLTVQGTRLDTRAVRHALGVKKVRVASADDLLDHFAALPGAAYPFGFAGDIPILVDPAIYAEDWMLFSAPLPTVTHQFRGHDLKELLAGLPNVVVELRPVDP
jgi:Ala-tRNA(Pro) deacylase